MFTYFNIIALELQYYYYIEKYFFDVGANFEIERSPFLVPSPGVGECGGGGDWLWEGRRLTVGENRWSSL